MRKRPRARVAVRAKKRWKTAARSQPVRESITRNDMVKVFLHGNPTGKVVAVDGNMLRVKFTDGQTSDVPRAAVLRVNGLTVRRFEKRKKAYGNKPSRGGKR